MSGRRNKKKNILTRLNETGLIPLTYHNEGDQRLVHYNATFVAAAGVTLITMAAFLSTYGFTDAVTEEQAWWGNIDKTYHNVAAVVTLAAAIGVVSAPASMLYNVFSKLQRNILGTSALPGVWKYSPYHKIPFEAFTGIYAATSFVTIILFTLMPDIYSAFADSGYAHVASILLASITVASVAGLAAVIDQKAVSYAHDLAARWKPSLFNFEKDSCLDPQIEYIQIESESEDEESRKTRPIDNNDALSSSQKLTLLEQQYPKNNNQESFNF